MRVALGVGAVVLAVVLLVVLKDDGQESSSDGMTATRSRPAEPAVTEIVVDKSGKSVGGVAEISVEKDEEIRFEVRSEVADEVHVHGYDIGKEVDAGGSVGFDFPATIEGVFEVELESRGEQILELRVNP